jgi:tetratricopeptide (TPR) repeat protein
VYLDYSRPKRKDSPWRVLILAILIIAGLYVIREQLSGASWTRPFDPTPVPTRSAESYFDEAEILYEEGLLDEAIAAYRQAFALDPQDNVSLFCLARLMVIRGQTDQVLKEYGARLQDEEWGDAHTLAVLSMALDWHAVFNSKDLLLIYVALGVLDEDEIQAPDWEYSREKMTRYLVRAAQKTAERALRLDADLPEAYAYLAEALADRERYEEAKAAAETAIQLNPNIPDTQRAMGYVYEVQGEYEQAIAFYKAAIQAHSKLDFLHVAVGKSYRAIGWRLIVQDEWDEAMPHFERAIAYFEEALKINPNNPSLYDEIGWTFGYYMGYIGDDREAMQRGLDYLEEALSQDPEFALAYRHLGQVYYNLRNYEEAIPAFEKAFELGDLPPADAILSHIMLGWSYYALDLDDKGPEEKCDRALPQFQAAWDILGDLPQRELGFERMAWEGLDKCGAPP